MSLFLGIYSKKEDVSSDRFSEVLADFSLGGTRELETKSVDQVMFSVVTTGVASRQIVSSESDDRVILFAGELYNYAKYTDRLIEKGYRFKDRSSSAECLLHLYEDDEDGFPPDLNGRFACAIYDKKEAALVLVNDCFGIFPLFIYESDEVIIFSSEYEPITAYRRFDGRLNDNAVAQYFALGLPLGDRTFFYSIRNLAPGTILKMRPGRIDSRRYDELDIPVDRSLTIEDSAEKVAAVVKESVRARAGQANERVCTLTGGADTRLMLSCMTETQRQQTRFVTEKSLYVEDDNNRDIIIARMLARHLGLNHDVVEPEATSAQHLKTFGDNFFDTRRPIRAAGMLTGVHGSQFLGGLCYRMTPILPKNIDFGRTRKKLRFFFRKAFLNSIDNVPAVLSNELAAIKAENISLLFSIHQLTRGFFTQIFKGSLSGWLDPCSFPTRFDTVFGDPFFLKTILAVPQDYIAEYRLYNLIYKNCFPELASFPTNSGLSNRPNASIPRIQEGVEPKSVHNPGYLKALKQLFHRDGRSDSQDRDAWGRQRYSQLYRAFLSGSLFYRQAFPAPGLETHRLVMPFIDFETWYRRFVR